MQKFNVGQKEDQGFQWWWVGNEAVLLDCGNQANVSSILHEWRVSTYSNECYIQRWHPYIGFSDSSNFKQAFWVMIKGVPVHLWDDDIFEQLVEDWGKIIQWNDGHEARRELTSRRVLVRGDRMKIPSLINLRWGDLIYEVGVEPEWEAVARIAKGQPSSGGASTGRTVNDATVVRPVQVRGSREAPSASFRNQQCDKSPQEMGKCTEE